LKPKYIQKIDIGTQPGDYSIAILYKHMEVHTDCGGAGGETVIDTTTKKNLATWEGILLTYIQYYEFKQTVNSYKMFEGCGGFVMVISGCFCMFRYDALKG